MREFDTSCLYSSMLDRSLTILRLTSFEQDSSLQQSLLCIFLNRVIIRVLIL